MRNSIICMVEHQLEQNGYTKMYQYQTERFSYTYKRIFYHETHGFIVYLYMDLKENRTLRMDFFVNIDLIKSNISEKDVLKKLNNFSETKIIGKDKEDIEVYLNLEYALKKVRLEELTNFISSNFETNLTRRKPYILNFIV